MHRGDGFRLCMLMFPDNLQKWLDYGHNLWIFLILALFWLSEMGQTCGFWAFPGECMERIAWNFACWCILTTFRTGNIFVMVCWFSSFWHHFNLVKWVKFGVSRHFPDSAWREWPKILHADLSWPPLELIIFWSCSADFPHNSYLGCPGIIWRTPGSKCQGGSGGIFLTFYAEFCLVLFWV